MQETRKRSGNKYEKELDTIYNQYSHTASPIVVPTYGHIIRGPFWRC